MLNQDDKNVLSEGMKIKFAENGISFGILKDISTKFGKMDCLLLLHYHIQCVHRPNRKQE